MPVISAFLADTGPPVDRTKSCKIHRPRPIGQRKGRQEQSGQRQKKKGIAVDPAASPGHIQEPAGPLGPSFHRRSAWLPPNPADHPRSALTRLPGTTESSDPLAISASRKRAKVIRCRQVILNKGQKGSAGLKTVALLLRACNALLS